jgi:peptidoglycan/LPS O-acetylase OafA/YrhL
MPRQIDTLTSLRFFAAFAVVLHHLSDFSRLDIHNAFVDRATLAVDFFFVLSGFILMHVHGADFRAGFQSCTAFYGARFARIYPAHLAVMLFFAAYIALASIIGLKFNHDRFSLFSFVAHVSLLDAWGVDDKLSWNYPAWSISAEWAAYLVFPFLAWASLKLSRRGSLPLLVGTIALFLCLANYLHITARTVDLSVLRILPEFCLGIAAYEVSTRHDLRAVSPDLQFVVAAIFLAAGFLLAAPDAVIVLGFVWLIVAAANSVGYVRTALSNRRLLMLGEESYSLYLVHAFVLSLVFNVLLSRAFTTGAGLAAVEDILAVGLSILAAYFLHRRIEVPTRRWLRSAFSARPRTPVVDPVPADGAVRTAMPRR